MLHIDVETYSEVDLKKSGAYKYAQAPSFEVLMLAYGYTGMPVDVVDLAQGESIPPKVLKDIKDPKVKKVAHNATFERLALFHGLGIETQPQDWMCTMVMAANAGLPLSLKKASEALDLTQQKDSKGSSAIRYFSMPCKPTKVNEGRTRNLPEHDPEKWEEFKSYCAQDVVVERDIYKELIGCNLTKFEWDMYRLDQEINDRGVLVDLDFADKIQILNARHIEEVKEKMIDLTGIDNPNSLDQVKMWITEQGVKVEDLRAATVKTMIKDLAPGPVRDVLRLRAKLGKTSVKKYKAMQNYACSDGRVRGLFQFLGAGRTGRWAGRGVQLHNLPQNKFDELGYAKEVIREGDLEAVKLLYGDASSLFSQLIRSAFIAPKGKTFCVADFSAIEARVIAWLAGEKWRMDVFNDHGKIYEASASMMFGVPIEQITKGSDLRSKGKVAELALGYQGGVGAMKAMGGEKMGLSEDEMRQIVQKWRRKSPAIVKFWDILNKAAIMSVKACRTVELKNYHGITFHCDTQRKFMTVKLPSGRKLYYARPSLIENRSGMIAVQYYGTQAKAGWGPVETYGGKLSENITQAVARDALAESMMRLDRRGFDLVMHVHDEVIAEIPENGAEKELDRMCEIMSIRPEWAADLPLTADGYITPYYKKD